MVERKGERVKNLISKECVICKRLTFFTVDYETKSYCPKCWIDNNPINPPDKDTTLESIWGEEVANKIKEENT